MRAAPTMLAALVALAGCSETAAPPAPDRSVTIEIDEPSRAGKGPDRPPMPDPDPPPELPGGDACPGARDPTTSENERAAEIAIRCLTNAARSARGLDELAFDERLARAAATRSNDMAEQDYFSHDGPDGGNVQRAVRRTGWIPEQRSWLLGENIGWAPGDYATPARMVRSWLDSPKHRANLLSKDFTEIGVGAIAAVPKRGAEAGATYTQVFGVTGRRARQALRG